MKNAFSGRLPKNLDICPLCGDFVLENWSEQRKIIINWSSLSLWVNQWWFVHLFLLFYILWYRPKTCGASLDFKINGVVYIHLNIFSSLKNALEFFINVMKQHTTWMISQPGKWWRMSRWWWWYENDNSREGGKGCDLIIGPDEKIEVQWGVFKLISV